MLRIIQAYVFVITLKFSWRWNPVQRACLCWEDHRILFSNRGGGYWKRIIVFFHSQFNRIIPIISADRAECGLLNTETQLPLTDTQNLTLFCNMTATLYKPVVTIKNQQFVKKRRETISPSRSLELQLNEISHKMLRKYKIFQNSLQYKICNRPLHFKQ
jgi:hypothetical protein